MINTYLDKPTHQLDFRQDPPESTATTDPAQLAWQHRRMTLRIALFLICFVGATAILLTLR